MTARKGFTLVELLIVISIITILSGILIPSFTSYLKQQNVKQAQQQLVGDMRSVQNKALTGTLSDEIINGNPVEYWGIEFSEGSNSYNEFIATGVISGCGTAEVDKRVQNTYTLKNDIRTKGVPQCILISNSDGGIDIPIPSGSFTDALPFLEIIYVGYADSDSENKQVLFNPAGLIYANN